MKHSEHKKCEDSCFQRHLDEALAAFDKLLKVYPRSPRAHYGKAKTLELIAAEKQSNAFLDASIREYETVSFEFDSHCRLYSLTFSL